MGVKRFVKDVKEVLGLADFSEEKKKKAIKKLIKKLEARRAEDKKLLLSKDIKNKTRKEVKEDLQLIHYQIKKGKKLLESLEKPKESKGKVKNSNF